MEEAALHMVGDPLLRSPADNAQGVGSAEIERIYADHHLRLKHLAAAITLDRSVAEEVVHDAFLALQQRRTTIRNPLAYLHRSVVHGSIGIIRRRRTAARYPMPLAQPTINPEIDETWAAVAELPARERAVVVLRFWQDMSEADIATTLQWPNGTVKSTLHRALKRLRKELEHAD